VRAIRAGVPLEPGRMRRHRITVLRERDDAHDLHVQRLRVHLASRLLNGDP
jgi:hypothetical protein